ncbi:MAG: YaaA family protein, partial [Planctomycetota bacterium]
MLTVVSPAKTLDFETRSPIAKSKTTIPAFVPESAALVKKMKTLTPKRLQDLMGVSKNLADLNHQRYQDWDEASIAPQGKAAVFAFQGDVYQGLRAENFTAKQLEYAQAHFRILSGLYGILRPLDLILPYRLEMGIPLK